MNVSPLKAVAKVPNDKAVTHLERLLDMAKKGELKGFMLVALFDDDTTTQGWTLPSGGMTQTPKMLGEFLMLASNLANQCVGVREEDIV